MEAIQLRLDPVISTENALWMGFTLDADDNYCNARFLKRFGRFPAQIRIVNNIKLVGPIPADRAPSLQGWGATRVESLQ